MSGEQQLRAFIERILRLKEEQDTLADDIREVYAEARGEGYDKTALGEVVSYLRKIEKKGKHAVDERTAIFDLYLTAYERSPHTHAPARTREASETTEHEQPETAHETHERPSTNAEASPEAGPQAEASQSQGTGAGTLAGHEGRSEGEAASACLPTNPPSAALLAAKPEAVSPVPPAASGTISTSSGFQGVTDGNPSKPSPDAGAGDVSAPAERKNAQSEQAAHHSDDDVPAFLRQELPRKTAADYRPHCQHPEACAASGLQHCYSCSKLIAARESEVA